MEIRKAEIEDTPEIARIHQEEIQTGFLSRSGIGILPRLYRHLVLNEIVFVSVSGNEIAGFVSCSLNKGRLYRRFILRQFFPLIPVLAGKIFSIRFVKGAFENILSVKKDKSQWEPVIPELLSIAVKKNRAGKGAGQNLLAALEQELSKRGFYEYKVIAGENLVSANAFYRQNGFQFVNTIQVHKNENSNLYKKTIR